MANTMTYENQFSYPATHPLAGLEQSVESLCECGRMFHDRNWSLGTSSNYSLVVESDPLELVITASGKDKRSLDWDDFVRIGVDGLPTATGQPKSSAETLLHVVAAKQPSVGAVLHTHSVWGTILSKRFAEKGGFEISDYEMLKGLVGIETHETNVWVPIVENTQDIASLAIDIEKRLSDSNNPMAHGYLIEGHGLYTWGQDLHEARRHVEIFEFLFECVGRQIAMH